jgi:hypothetical protein
MTGYKYNTEQEAQAAMAQCDTYYGYPKAGAVTEHWCAYQYSDLDGFYYIVHDQTIETVLGTPVTFDVTMPELPLN